MRDAGSPHLGLTKEWDDNGYTVASFRRRILNGCSFPLPPLFPPFPPRPRPQMPRCQLQENTRVARRRPPSLPRSLGYVGSGMVGWLACPSPSRPPPPEGGMVKRGPTPTHLASGEEGGGRAEGGGSNSPPMKKERADLLKLRHSWEATPKGGREGEGKRPCCSLARSFDICC